MTGIADETPRYRLFDGHVHTKYSNRGSGKEVSDEHLKRMSSIIGRLVGNESFTEPERVFRNLKSQGFPFVTITDHDTIEGALELQEAHPESVIPGIELSSYFRERGEAVPAHVLVYGVDRKLYPDLMHYRKDIRELSAFLHSRSIPFALAHPFCTMNGGIFGSGGFFRREFNLSLLLFPLFETRNGSIGRYSNDVAWGIINALTPDMLFALAERYETEPLGELPWVKGTVGGSDDHSGLIPGRSWTVASKEATTPAEALSLLGARKTVSAGNDGSPFVNAVVYADILGLNLRKIFVFERTIDLGRKGRKRLARALGFVQDLNRVLFRAGKFTVRKRLAVKVAFMEKGKAKQGFSRLLKGLDAVPSVSCDSRLELAFDALCDHVDGLLEEIAVRIDVCDREKSLNDAGTILKASVTASLAMASIAVLSRHVTKDRRFAEKMAKEYGVREYGPVLVFSSADENREEVKKAVSAAGSKGSGDDALHYVHVSPFTPFGLFGKCREIMLFRLNVPATGIFGRFGPIPSFLGTLKVVIKERPSRIVIQDMGSTAFVAALCGTLCSVPVVMIYSDPSREKTIGEDHVPEFYAKALFALCSKIIVPDVKWEKRLRHMGVSGRKIHKERSGTTEPKMALA